ncbi:MAG: FAD-dependent oxidoreductase, partial [Candidatus Omnitrophota bacterium]
MAQAEDIYDIAVIGGGIAGAGIARDASLRGFRVLLLEKNQFGSGTSSKSSKLIHGGLRYLELAWNAFWEGKPGEVWKNFRFVITSLRESAILERTYPELVRPIALTIPIYREQKKNPLLLYAGALFYGFLAILTGNPRLPRIYPTAGSILRKIPLLNPQGLSGGVEIWDHWTDDHGLTNRIIESAVRHGAHALEFSPVTAFHWDPLKKTYQVDVMTEKGVQVFYAKKLVNAAGPWVDHVRDLGRERTVDFVVPVAGCHIELPRFLDTSVILQAPDERLFFVINQEDRARVGTTEKLQYDLDAVIPTEEEIEYLLAALERYFPSKKFDPSMILSADAGIRPLAP